VVLIIDVNNENSREPMTLRRRQRLSVGHAVTLATTADGRQSGFGLLTRGVAASCQTEWMVADTKLSLNIDRQPEAMMAIKYSLRTTAAKEQIRSP